MRSSPSSRPRAPSSAGSPPRFAPACVLPSCARRKGSRSSCSTAMPLEAGRRRRGEKDVRSRSMEEKRFPVTHSDEEWRKLLTPEQYDILRGHGTEAPGTCALNYEKRAGTFSCAGCGQELFASKKKFESGTGWPSFNDPVAGAVETTSDRRYGSHLGHVFEDGPPPTHLRYCINGVAMNFKPE